jgi:hypothetical protein
VLPSLYLRFAHGRATQEPMPEEPGDSDDPPIDPNGDGSGSEPLQVSLQA